MAIARTNACEFNAKELGKFAVIMPTRRGATKPRKWAAQAAGPKTITRPWPLMKFAPCRLPRSRTKISLFLWATAPKLAESMQAIESWGFTYRTNMVWGKDKIGLGFYDSQPTRASAHLQTRREPHPTEIGTMQLIGRGAAIRA